MRGNRPKNDDRGCGFQPQYRGRMPGHFVAQPGEGLRSVEPSKPCVELVFCFAAAAKQAECLPAPQRDSRKPSRRRMRLFRALSADGHDCRLEYLLSLVVLDHGDEIKIVK